MRYLEYRDLIQAELTRNANGLTWAQLKAQLDLPYDRPCPNWTQRLEQDIGLRRVKGSTAALVWAVSRREKRGRS